MDTAQQRFVEEVTRRVVLEFLKLTDPYQVPVGVSNRHVHLSQADFQTLFGRDTLTVKKYVRQPLEFACEETVAVHGPRGSFAAVRLMGPFRKQSQVELSRTDCIALGVDAPICESGHLDEAAPIDIEGPAGRIHLAHAAMVAGRHVHLGPDDAERMKLTDGQRVRVRIPGRRGGVLDNFLVRVKQDWIPEVHLDTDEANGVGVTHGMSVQILTD